MMTTEQTIVFITGMSGAGRTFALKTLEDMGYDAVDNLPISLISLFLHTHEKLHKPVAIGIDARAHDFATGKLMQQIQRLRAQAGCTVRIIFCDCDNTILAQRFTESRRRHPLADERPMIDGIRIERELMAPMRDEADFILDTTSLSIVECRHILREHFLLPWSRQLTCHVMSFAFRHGLPRDADVVLDVRFLINPHYNPALEPLTGRDQAVQAYIAEDPTFKVFMDHVASTLSLVMPRFDADGRSYVTIAFGCTGGKHRSVFCAEHLASWLKHAGRNVHIRHRDLSGLSSIGMTQTPETT